MTMERLRRHDRHALRGGWVSDLWETFQLYLGRISVSGGMGLGQRVDEVRRALQNLYAVKMRLFKIWLRRPVSAKCVAFIRTGFASVASAIVIAVFAAIGRAIVIGVIRFAVGV